MSTDINLRSSYVRYKRNTGQLVRWLINTVSTVAPKHVAPANSGPKPRKGGKKGSHNQPPPPPSTSEPVISIRSFVEYAKVIASANPKVNIPPAVYSLFDSVIHARRMVASFYHRLEVDIEVEAKNESHMAFIKILETAFDILGGTNWKEQIRKEEREKATKDNKDVPEVEEEDSLKLSNRFAELEVGILSRGSGIFFFAGLSYNFRLRISTLVWRRLRLHLCLVKKKMNGSQISSINLVPEKARRARLHNRLALLRTWMQLRKRALQFGAFSWM